MRKLFVLLTVIASLFACSGEDVVLDNLTSEETLLSRSTFYAEFKIERLFEKTDGDIIDNNPNMRSLTEAQWTKLCMLGNQSFMIKSPLIYEMAKRLKKKLKRKKIVLVFDFTPYQPGDWFYDKDGYYDSIMRRIYFRNEVAIMSERIILHELLHAFQIELAGMEPTLTNELEMEFDVQVVHDILQIMMWDGDYDGDLVGGERRTAYHAFVNNVAKGAGGCNKECMLNEFKALYKAKYGKDYNCAPGLFLYLLELPSQI